MGYLVLIVLLVFILFFYAYNNLMNTHLKIKELFLEIEGAIFRKEDIVKRIQELIIEDEKLNRIIEEENAFDLTKILFNNVEDNRGTEDRFQKQLVENNNNINKFINQLSVFLGEDEKLKDSGVKEETILDIQKEILEINQIKSLYKDSKEEFNFEINSYNKRIKIFPVNLVANILGFTSLNIIK